MLKVLGTFNFQIMSRASKILPVYSAKVSSSNKEETGPTFKTLTTKSSIVMMKILEKTQIWTATRALKKIKLSKR